jgi:hypothetical protein
MIVMFSVILPLLFGLLAQFVDAQQFAGSVINNSIQAVPGFEKAYWNIPTAGNKASTIINYSSLNSSNQRPANAGIQRVLIFFHGNDRDPWNYASYMGSALNSIVGHPEVNRNSMLMVAPYFPNVSTSHDRWPHEY